MAHLSVRASFDDFLDDADLPDETLPSQKSKLPRPGGPAFARGPAALPSLLSCDPTPKASASKKTIFAPSARPQSTPQAPKPSPASYYAHFYEARRARETAAPSATLAPPSTQTSASSSQPASGQVASGLVASDLSAAAPAQTPARGTIDLATPPRSRVGRKADDVDFTPAPVKLVEPKQGSESKDFESTDDCEIGINSTAAEIERHCLKQQKLVQEENEAMIVCLEEEVEVAREQAWDEAFFGAGPSTPASESMHSESDCRTSQAAPCETKVLADRQVVPCETTSALSSHSLPEAVDTGKAPLQLVPYKPIGTSLALVPTTPVKKRARKNIAITPSTPVKKSKAVEELRGSEMVEVPIEVFAPGGEPSRRPKRLRIPTLEFWRGEHVVYERLPGSDTMSVKAVVLNRAGERFAQLALEDREAQLTIEDKHRLPALKDKARLPALKDKPRTRRRKRVVESSDEDFVEDLA